jgi:hypothetical protein
MNTPQNPTLEAAEAGECPEGQISPSGLSAPQTADGNAAVEAAVTAGAHDADASDGAEPDRPATQQAAPSHPPGNRRANAASTAQVDVMPRWLRRQIEQAYVPLPNAHFVPRILRRPGMVVTSPVTRASGAHLEPVGQHELDDDAKIPEFLRCQGVTSLATHARPIASDRGPSEGSQADQPSRFVPSILREAGLVTFPVTPSQAPPASVTPTVTAAPVAGSVCPTCRCRVPARLTPAERQRAYRRRKREQGQGVAKGD